MKYLAAFGITVVVAVTYFMVERHRAAQTPEAIHAEWKRTTAENETKVRPERFESMKWHPGDENVQPVEMRAPASDEVQSPKAKRASGKKHSSK